MDLIILKYPEGTFVTRWEALTGGVHWYTRQPYSKLPQTNAEIFNDPSIGTSYNEDQAVFMWLPFIFTSLGGAEMSTWRWVNQ